MKKSLKDIAYERIRSRILQCDYLPGAMLSETALCQEMEISRTPVREALNKLEQENLVTIYPKKGILVKDLSVKDLHAIYETHLRGGHGPGGAHRHERGFRHLGSGG